MSLGENDRLYPPDDDSGLYWGSEHFAARYYPAGDPRTAVTDVARDTDQDIALYIIYKSSVTSAPSSSERFDDEIILGFVIRNSDGMQINFDHYEEGEDALRWGIPPFIDANWRNNVENTDSGHIDDYLEIVYGDYKRPRYLSNECLGGAMVKGIEKILAPPSDGRALIMNHAECMSGEEFFIESFSYHDGTSVSPPLVTYEYVPWGGSMGIQSFGKLKRVFRGNDGLLTGSDEDDADLGVEYEYGVLDVSGEDMGAVDVNVYHARNDIAKVYVTSRDGSYREPVIANHRAIVGTNGTYPYTQYLRDPADLLWRKYITVGQLNTEQYHPRTVR